MTHSFLHCQSSAKEQRTTYAQKMKFCKHIKPYFSLSALYFVEAVNINVHFFVWVRTFTAHYDLSFFLPRIRMMLLCRNKWQQRSCHIEFFMRRVGIHIFGFCFVMAAILLAMLRFTLIRPCTWFPWMPNECFFGMLYKVSNPTKLPMNVLRMQPLKKRQNV